MTPPELSGWLDLIPWLGGGLIAVFYGLTIWSRDDGLKEVIEQLRMENKRLIERVAALEERIIELTQS